MRSVGTRPSVRYVLLSVVLQWAGNVVLLSLSPVTPRCNESCSGLPPLKKNLRKRLDKVRPKR